MDLDIAKIGDVTSLRIEEDAAFRSDHEFSML